MANADPIYILKESIDSARKKRKITKLFSLQLLMAKNRMKFHEGRKKLNYFLALNTKSVFGDGFGRFGREISFEKDDVGVARKFSGGQNQIE